MSSWHHKKLLNNQKQPDKPVWLIVWSCEKQVISVKCPEHSANKSSDLKNKAMVKTCKQPALYNLE